MGGKKSKTEQNQRLCQPNQVCITEDKPQRKVIKRGITFL